MERAMSLSLTKEAPRAMPTGLLDCCDGHSWYLELELELEKKKEVVVEEEAEVEAEVEEPGWDCRLTIDGLFSKAGSGSSVSSVTWRFFSDCDRRGA